MRTESEIMEALTACEEACSYGLSSGPCPLRPDGRVGCCAECSAPSTLRWVLEEGDSPAANGQDALIAAFGGNDG